MDKLKMLRDRTDASKWAHPEIMDAYSAMVNLPPMYSEVIYNFDLPLEQRINTIKMFVPSGDEEPAVDVPEGEEVEAGNAWAAAAIPDNITVKKVTAVGCPEDPEVTVELVIYIPESTKKLPVLYSIPAGGMMVAALEMSNLWKLALSNDCIVVCPRYHGVYEAQYPTQMNQLHAGYLWVLENYAEINAKKDRIVLHGSSAGANLALSLAHRLKRFGLHPRGAVVESSFTDNRPIFPTSALKFGGGWDASAQWLASEVYLGFNNVSAFNDGEMYPNYATAEECIGLCPTFIHTETEEAGSAAVREYCNKLTQAGVYNELHVWGGGTHGNYTSTTGGEGVYLRAKSIVDGNIQDCFKFDLRRLWIEDMLGE